MFFDIIRGRCDECGWMQLAVRSVYRPLEENPEDRRIAQEAPLVSTKTLITADCGIQPVIAVVCRTRSEDLTVCPGCGAVGFEAEAPAMIVEAGSAASAMDRLGIAISSEYRQLRKVEEEIQSLLAKQEKLLDQTFCDAAFHAECESRDKRSMEHPEQSDLPMFIEVSGQTEDPDQGDLGLIDPKEPKE